MNPEKVPPHNNEAEQAVIGGMLLDTEALARVIELLGPWHFYTPANSKIFETVARLYSLSSPVDVLSVSDALRTAGTLEEVGGTSYLLSLVNSIPTTANIEYYAQIVERNAIMRRLIKAGTEIVGLGYHAEETDTGALLNIAEQKIFEIGQNKLGQGLEHIQPALWTIFEEIENAYSNPDSVQQKRLNTGISDLNLMLGGGFNPSDLIILAARPSMGKTSLAINMASSLALEQNKPVAIFSLEMSKEQLITRMLASEAGISSRTLRNADLAADEWHTLSNSISRLSEAPVFVDDSSMISPAEIRAKCRRLKAEKGALGLIVIDYLQLMEGTAGGSSSDGNRTQEMGKISRALKQLARELDCPVVALSQLSRAVESRTNKRPMLSDLRESGSIEQDADVVMFIYRDEYYNPDSSEKNVAEILISKHRNGPTGTVRTYFNKELTKFGNLIADF